MPGYAIKELFYSLQGEGARAGRPAVFLRFSGCNLWSGREADRATATCRFCDTDFVGTDGAHGGRYTAAELAALAGSLWPVAPTARDRAYAVLTGGEPALQIDRALVSALHARGFEVAIETNGTVALPTGLDWTTVSPKAGAPLVVTRGSELKLVYPQPGAAPRDYEHLDFRHFYLQPMDGPRRGENTRLAIEACLARPMWRLSTQAHKVWGVA
jgi:7-carboxy-7-deazaguanine synthase